VPGCGAILTFVRVERALSVGGAVGLGAHQAGGAGVDGVHRHAPVVRLGPHLVPPASVPLIGQSREVLVQSVQLLGDVFAYERTSTESRGRRGLYL
jgi:hypothetical protein